MPPRPPEQFRELTSLQPKGSAYRAHDPGSGGVVFLRCFETRAAALREARLLDRVTGGIVPRPLALVAGVHGESWLASEWVDGEPLDRCQGLPPTWPVELLRLLCHLHRHGIVHGDIHPANVLRRPNGRLCLVGFGRALPTGDLRDPARDGDAPGFAAPEWSPQAPADPRADLYAFVRTVRELAPHTLGRHPVLERLGADDPGQRPSATSEALRRIVGAYGLGVVPEPDLAWAGWRETCPPPQRFSRGLRTYLGVDAIVARRLTRLLLDIGGGNRERTNELWRAWLPAICPDPWQGQSAGVWLAGLRELKSIGARAAQREIRQLSPAARWLVSHQAQFVSPIDDARRVPDPADYGLLRGSSRFALVPSIEHPLVVELLTADILRVRRDGDGASAPRPGFATRALHQAAVLDLDALQATALHREISLALQSPRRAPGRTPPTQALRAWHLERCGEVSDAMREYVTAAATSFVAGDTSRGVRAVTQALRLAAPATPTTAIENLAAQMRRDDWPLECPSIADLMERYVAGLSMAGRNRAAARWDRARRRAGAARTQPSRSLRRGPDVRPSGGAIGQGHDDLEGSHQAFNSGSRDAARLSGGINEWT